MVICILIITAPISLAGDGMYPSVEDLGIHSGQTRTFDKYNIENYVFDIKPQGILNKGIEIVTSLASAIFQFHTFLCKGVVSILMGAFNVDLFTMFGSLVDNIIRMVETSIFYPLIQIALPITAVLVVINVVLYRFNTASRLIFSTIGALIVAFIFIKSPSTVLIKLNEVANEASGKILAGSASVITGQRVTEDDAIVNLGNVYWTMAVDKPWELIQFGSMGASASDINAFLSNSPESEEREKLATELANNGIKQFDKGRQATRFAMAAFCLIIILVVNIAIVILSALMILFQAGALVTAIIGMIVIALSLLPNIGFTPIEKWFMKLLGYITYKVAITLLLCTYFAINLGLYTSLPKYGWFFTMVLQAIVIVAVIYFRSDIFGVLTNIQTAGARLSNRLEQQESKVFRKNVAKAVASVYAVDRLANRVGEIRQQRLAKKEEAQYRPLANEFLTQKYMKEKQAAEERARKEGREVKKEDYSAFVRTTESRIEKGFTPFSEADINSTIQYMRALKREGNDPRKLLSVNPEGRSSAEIRYEQKALDQQTKQTDRDLRRRAYNNQLKLTLNTSPGPKLPTGIADKIVGEKAAKPGNTSNNYDDSFSTFSAEAQVASSNYNQYSSSTFADKTSSENVVTPGDLQGTQENSKYTLKQKRNGVRYTLDRDYIRSMVKQSTAKVGSSSDQQTIESGKPMTDGNNSVLSGSPQRRYKAKRLGKQEQIQEPINNKTSNNTISIQNSDNQRIKQEIKEHENNRIQVIHRGEKIIELHHITDVSNTVIEQDKRTEKIVQKEIRNESTSVKTSKNLNTRENKIEGITGGVNLDRRKKRLEQLTKKNVKGPDNEK